MRFPICVFVHEQMCISMGVKVVVLHVCVCMCVITTRAQYKNVLTNTLANAYECKSGKNMFFLFYIVDTFLSAWVDIFLSWARESFSNNDNCFISTTGTQLCSCIHDIHRHTGVYIYVNAYLNLHIHTQRNILTRLHTCVDTHICVSHIPCTGVYTSTFTLSLLQSHLHACIH